MSTETVYILRSQSTRKTGTVTISRKDRFAMRTLVWIRFFVYLLPFIILAVCVAAKSSWIDWGFMIGTLFLGLLMGLLASISGKGTMVESVCFDYDNRQVIVGQTDMKNQHMDVVNPFRSCVMKVKEPVPFTKRPIKLTMIQEGVIKSVLYFDYFMGWKYELYGRIEEELSGFDTEDESNE